MDFFKSVLPPLPKLPKLKKIRQWNGGSLLSLNQFPNLPAAFNLGSGAPQSAPQSNSTTTGHPVPPSGDFVRQPNGPAPHARHHHQQHMRHSSDISIISAAVSTRTPADYSHRDNLGLYALKCDRSAAKRGILLNLPRKFTQAVGGVGTGGGAPDMMVQHGAPAMVHEKYSPCKRHPPKEPEMMPEIKPPPRRRKRPPPAVGIMTTTVPQQQQPAGTDEDLGRWQKNSSELFRIVERESASTARARSAGGVGLPRAKKPHRTAVPSKTDFLDAPTSSSDGVVVEVVQKAQSVDNLLAVRYHRRRRGAFAEPERSHDESDSESSDRQVQSLRLHQPPHHHRRTASAAAASEVVSVTTDHSRVQGARAPLHHAQPPASGSTSLPTTVKPQVCGERAPPFQLNRASDFSIDNNSDEIEVRFRKGYSTDDSSDATITAPAAIKQDEEATKTVTRLPLPPRVVQLRRNDPGLTLNRGKTGGAPVVIRKSEPETVPAVVTPTPPLPTSSTTVVHPQFMPLAEVLRKSIDSAELKRKWINDFLSQGSESLQQSVDADAGTVTAMEIENAFVPQLDIVQRIDQQLQELESDKTIEAAPPPPSNGSSVDIFHRATCDFDEFDELFTPAEQHDTRKAVKLSEQITYIERSSTTSNLCFSSSSFSCASLEDGKPSLPLTAPLPPPPPPPPLPPPPSAPLPTGKGRMMSDESCEQPGPTILHRCEQPAGSGCKSTVKIQDYSSKHQHLQRVRYLSSPSPSRSSIVHERAGNIRGDVDSGGSVDTDCNEPNGQHRMRRTNAVLPYGISGYGTGEYGISPSNSSDDPLQQELEKLSQIGHWAVTERQYDSHTVETNRLSANSIRVNNNNIYSVLPDYSEYYNEEGVIII